MPPAGNKYVAEANLTRHQGKGPAPPFIFQPRVVAPVWNAAGRNTSDFKRPAGSSTPCSAPRRRVLLPPLFFLLEQRQGVFMPRPSPVNPLLYYSFILEHIILDPKQISTDIKVDLSLQTLFQTTCAARHCFFTASSKYAHAFGTRRKFGHKAERSNWVRSWKSFKLTLFHHKGTRGAF